VARRPAQWQRTDKFGQRRRDLRVLAQVRSETVLGLAGLLAAAVLVAFTRGGFATTIAIGVAMQSVAYLAAPAVAIAADRSLAREVPQGSWAGDLVASAPTVGPGRRLSAAGPPR